jgi:hypothetical protein
MCLRAGARRLAVAQTDEIARPLRPHLENRSPYPRRAWKRIDRQEAASRLRVMTLSAAWEEHAQEWIVWARTSDHDGF